MKRSKNSISQKSILLGALFFLVSACSLRLCAQDSLSHWVAGNNPVLTSDTITSVSHIKTTFSSTSYADSLMLTIDSAAIRRAIRKDLRKNREISPQRAAILSAVLPGLGQAYVGRPWKIPIIYAAGYGLYYFYDMYNDYYYYYRKEYEMAKLLGEETTNLENRRDQAAELKNYFIIGMSALYLLNMIDAMTDAYFKEYDISPDLTLKISPRILSTPTLVNNPQGLSYGISLSFGLK